MRRLSHWIKPRSLAIMLACYFAVGVAGLVLPTTRDWFIAAVPFTIIAVVLILFLDHGGMKRSVWLASLLIFAAGLLVEMAGVSTGLIFGRYQYGETLGPLVFHTPLLIGFNWLFLTYASMAIAGRFIEPLYFRSIAAASMMVVYDFALEPAAIRLDMWNWDGGAVPLQNYLARFVIAAAINYLAGSLSLPDRNNKAAAPLFFIQMIFFIVLDLWIVAEGIRAF